MQAFLSCNKFEKNVLVKAQAVNFGTLNVAEWL